MWYLEEWLYARLLKNGHVTSPREINPRLPYCWVCVDKKLHEIEPGTHEAKVYVFQLKRHEA